MSEPTDPAPRQHELKTWTEFFEPVFRGDKTFEIRQNDRNFYVGDELWLREYNVGSGYTGRECWRLVTFILSADSMSFDSHVLKSGYVILGIKESRAQRTEGRPPEIDERLQAIRIRAQQASKGPWYRHGGVFESHGSVSHWAAPVTQNAAHSVADVMSVTDADFIAHSREDVPYLLAQVADLQSQIEELTIALHEGDRRIVELDTEVATERQRLQSQIETLTASRDALLAALERTREYIRTAMRPESVKAACYETAWDRAERSGLKHGLNAINAEFGKVQLAAGGRSEARATWQQLRALAEKWRDHADKDSDASTEAFDVGLRICADELEALLPSASGEDQ
jgi:hypothetical protein